MEAGIRLLHASCGLIAVQREDPSVAADLAEEWWPLLQLHAVFIRDRLSLYSSANNHLLVELAALLVFARLADDGPGESEAQWSRALAVELDRQFTAEGVNREGSLNYAALVHYALRLTLDVRAGTPEIRSRLKTLLAQTERFLRDLGAGTAAPFQFGDSDDAELLGGWRLPALQDEPTREPTCVRRWSGYLLARSGPWEAFLDAADDGLPPTYGHAHADLLAVQVRYGDALVIGDPGTFAYLQDPDLRTALRARSAHSAYGPEGWEPIRFTGPFQGKPAPGQRWSGAAEEGGWAWIYGGYRAPSGFVLERAVLCGGGACIILDAATPGRDASRSHLIGRLRIAPGWQVRRHPDRPILEHEDRGYSLSVRVHGRPAPRLSQEQAPFSPRFLARVEGNVISASQDPAPETLLVTVLAPSEAVMQWEGPHRLTIANLSVHVRPTHEGSAIGLHVLHSGNLLATFCGETDPPVSPSIGVRTG